MKLASMAYLSLAAGFAYLFHAKYLQFAGCFNELGRCADPSGSGQVYSEAGATWGYVMVVFLGLALWSGIRQMAQRPKRF